MTAPQFDSLGTRLLPQSSPRLLRSLAFFMFALGLGLAALPGCGPAQKGDKKDEKKDEKKDDAKPNAGDAKPNTKPDVPPKNTLGPVEPAAEQTATAFLRDVVHGTAKAESLSSGFLKAVGKPLQFPSDKEKGYSPDSAVSWLKRIGEGNTFGPAMKQEQVGDTVYIRGAMQKPGGYCLRLVKEGGAWKVDWLSVSSVEAGPIAPLPTPDGVAQNFAAAAFVETLADKDGMPPGERATLLGSAMVPALRTAWAAPFDQDKAQGYDFNPGILTTAAVKIGGGTSSYTATRVGDLPEFKVELTKPTGKKAYVVKLVKGAGAQEWLVSEVTEAKG